MKFQGFSTEVTKAVGEYGVDLLLTKQGKKIAVQAKRPSCVYNVNYHII